MPEEPKASNSDLGSSSATEVKKISEKEVSADMENSENNNDAGGSSDVDVLSDKEEKEETTTNDEDTVKKEDSASLKTETNGKESVSAFDALLAQKDDHKAETNSQKSIPITSEAIEDVKEEPERPKNLIKVKDLSTLTEPVPAKSPKKTVKKTPVSTPSSEPRLKPGSYPCLTYQLSK